MITRCFSFGFGHVDPVTGENLANKYARVTAADQETCRRVMTGLFGHNWSMEYPDNMLDQWGPRPLPVCHVIVTVVDGRVAQRLARVEEPDHIDVEVAYQVEDLLTPDPPCSSEEASHVQAHRVDVRRSVDHPRAVGLVDGQAGPGGEPAAA